MRKKEIDISSLAKDTGIIPSELSNLLSLEKSIDFEIQELRSRLTLSKNEKEKRWITGKIEKLLYQLINKADSISEISNVVQICRMDELYLELAKQKKNAICLRELKSANDLAKARSIFYQTESGSESATVALRKWIDNCKSCEEIKALHDQDPYCRTNNFCESIILALTHWERLVEEKLNKCSSLEELLILINYLPPKHDQDSIKKKIVLLFDNFSDLSVFCKENNYVLKEKEEVLHLNKLAEKELAEIIIISSYKKLYQKYQKMIGEQKHPLSLATKIYSQWKKAWLDMVKMSKKLEKGSLQKELAISMCLSVDNLPIDEECKAMGEKIHSDFYKEKLQIGLDSNDIDRANAMFNVYYYSKDGSESEELALKAILEESLKESDHFFRLFILSDASNKLLKNIPGYRKIMRKAIKVATSKDTLLAIVLNDKGIFRIRALKKLAKLHYQK